MDNDIIDNLYLVDDILAAASTLCMNALDFHPTKSLGYVDVRKEDFDDLAKAVDALSSFEKEDA
jgi:hypothetical protein